MSTVLNESVLILSNRWSVVGFYSVEDAIVSCIRERSSFLDTRDLLILSWDEWLKYSPPPQYKFVQTPNRQVAAPEIAILREYGERPPRKLTFSKLAVYRRDNNKCAYCQTQLPSPALTLDHVHPRSRGGRTDWFNTTAACSKCNSKKADKTPEEAGMPMRNKLVVPGWTPTLRVPKGAMKESWKPFLDKENLL